jgi:hypothetical protein
MVIPGYSELRQATKDLIRYMEEFPEQDVFSREELGNWLEDVVLPLRDEKLIDLFKKVLSKSDFREHTELYVEPLCNRDTNKLD